MLVKGSSNALPSYMPPEFFRLEQSYLFFEQIGAAVVQYAGSVKDDRSGDDDINLVIQVETSSHPELIAPGSWFSRRVELKNYFESTWRILENESEERTGRGGWHLPARQRQKSQSR